MNPTSSSVSPLAGSPLAPILEKHRTTFNALFASLSGTGQGIDPAAFAAHLAGPFKALADAVHAVAPDRLEQVVRVLFRISLELFAKHKLGTENQIPLLHDLWVRVLPAAAAAVAAEPRAVVASLSNAAVNLGGQPPAVTERWLSGMSRLTGECRSPDDLLRVATVLAWLSGMPQYRPSAIETWKPLPDRLRRLSLGLDPAAATPTLAEIEGGLADPWLRPGLPANTPRRLSLACVVGGFRGFGGIFIEPPILAADEDTVYAYDSETCCSLHADCFGATLRRMREPPANVDQSVGVGFSITRKGEVRRGAERVLMPELAGCNSQASTPHMLVVSLPNSHKLYVVASTPVEEPAP